MIGCIKTFTFLAIMRYTAEMKFMKIKTLFVVYFYNEILTSR